MSAALSYHAAQLLSNAVNPLLILIWLAAAISHRRKKGASRYVAASLAAVLLTYLIVHGFRWLGLWPAHPEFPSGHETLAASLGTSLALLNLKWLAAVLPLLAILTIALVRAHYHQPLDIAGALVVSPLLTLLCHQLVKSEAPARN